MAISTAMMRLLQEAAGMDVDRTGPPFSILLIIAAVVPVLASHGCALPQASQAAADA